MMLRNQVKREFVDQFNTEPLLVRSPGRINLIGEHIDYNGGLVFPAAIDKEIVVAISKSDTGQSIFVSVDLEDSIKIESSTLELQPTGHWANYPIGVVQQLANRGFSIPNFNLVFAGNIPIGAGLSSSAALENGVVFGLNKLFDLGLSKLEMVKISQQAEHEAVGVACGIMDQFASMFGVENQALILNCDTLEHESVPIDLGDYRLLLINTNVKHQLSDSPYNERRDQCAKGLSVLQKTFTDLKALAHANLAQLEYVKDQLSDLEFNRCQFVIEEQQRVLEAKSTLETCDINLLGELLFASHEGLKNLYEVSCSELDFLVDQASANEQVLGARMMGGGFGGCTINLIQSDQVEAFISRLSEQFEFKFGRKPTAIEVALCDGTGLVENH
ncbi:MAG: galactokinase [Bacteroidia bacterium]|jgi:galactokinase